MLILCPASSGVYNLNLVSLTAQSRLARVFALVAMLLVTGLASAESSHQHAADDSRLECLLCQGSVDSPAAPQVFAADGHVPPHIPCVAPTSAALRSHAVAPPARGPPALS